MAAVLEDLARGAALGREAARSLMGRLLAGEVTPAQAGAFLMALRVRGETVEELVGFVEAMRAACVPVRPARELVIDLCGTGGDGSGTFNISTAAALVVAAAGVAVAKHGNRAASSRAGSADVLEALGVPIDLPPERAARAIEELGFGFLFAPAYHPAMKHAGPARRELGIRTVFNLLGPLASPAAVARQLVGVFDDRARGLLARVLALLGSERAWVVHGEGGLDEVSIAGATRATAAGADGLRDFVVRPEEAGLAPAPLEALRGGDAGANAGIVMAVLAGERGPRRDAVLLNAAAGLVVAGAAGDLREGAERAAAAVDSGAAGRLLDGLRRFR
jgi:anthranilate phosphoribosyltransferase